MRWTGWLLGGAGLAAFMKQTRAGASQVSAQHCTEATSIQAPSSWAPRQDSTHHIHRAENMAIVVAGLQVLGDVGKGTEVLGVLGCAGNVPDLMLRDDVLPGKAGPALAL